jgi:hypothetical protein
MAAADGAAIGFDGAQRGQAGVNHEAAVGWGFARGRCDGAWRGRGEDKTSVYRDAGVRRTCSQQQTPVVAAYLDR